MRLRALGVLLALLGAPLAAQEVTAILEPADLVELRPLVAGRLLTIEADEGQEVSKGSVLARINDSQQAKRVALAEVVAAADGQMARAAAQVAQAQEVLARVQAARDRGAAQPWEVVQAEQAVTLASAEMQIARDAQAQAEAQLRLERAQLADYTLVAPFDGHVLEHGVAPGASIDPGTTLMIFARLTVLEATAFLPRDWAAELRAGQDINATIDDLPPKDVNLQVAAIDPRIDPASQTVRVTFALQNPDLAYQPGATLVLSAP